MKLIYKVEDRPPLGTSFLLALQHLLAALGAIIAVPLVVAAALQLPQAETVALVNGALLMSGIVTIVQCLGFGQIGIRLPCVMGTSFNFVAIAIMVGLEHGVAGILGSSLIGSMVMIAGSFFMPTIRHLFPPVVTGTVVTMIGLSLVPVAIDWMAGAPAGSPEYGTLNHLAIAMLVLAIIALLVLRGRGLFATAAVVIGIGIGYAICLAMGVIDFAPVHEAAIFALPTPLHFGLSFPIGGIIGMAIAYLVTIVESTGNFMALAEATQTRLTGKKLYQGVLCDGVGSALAALFSTTPFSSFCQNIGIVSITGVASRFVVALTGLLLMLGGLFPILSAIIVTIPQPVLGGAGVIMFAMIITEGVKILGRVEFDKRNGLIIAISIAAGMAVMMRPELLQQLPDVMKNVFSSGITTGSLMAISLNLLLPKDLSQNKSEVANPA